MVTARLVRLARFVHSPQCNVMSDTYLEFKRKLLHFKILEKQLLEIIKSLSLELNEHSGKKNGSK